jgi:ketosteroid isomerase-like protein
MHPDQQIQSTLLLEAFNQAFNRHDVAAMMAMMTEDCLFENTYPPPDGARYVGQEAVRSFWEDFFRASTGAHIQIEEVFTAGERGFQRWIYSWRDEQGSRGTIRGVDLFRFRDGRIAEKLSYVKG